MLNKAPIILNGFQRGGTNVLDHLIASHPDICMLGRESHEVFTGKQDKILWKLLCRFFYIPIALVASPHLFRPHHHYIPRKNVPNIIQKYIDLLFYWNKMRFHLNKLKEDKTRRSRNEIGKARLFFKNVNANVFAAPMFAEMYPDATFIALVRNGFAICEGRIRRGSEPEVAGELYECVCQQMIHDAKAFDNYHIIRFEDFLADPVSTIKKIFEYANLDLSKVKTFIVRKVINQNGIRKYEKMRVPIDQIENHLQKNKNEIQIAQLDDQSKQIFLKYAQKSMEYFGYV